MLVEVKPISWPGVNSLVARFVTRGAQTTPEPTTGVFCIKCTLNKADIVWHEQQEEPESLGLDNMEYSIFPLLRDRIYYVFII